MADSILESTKKALGLVPEYKVFDSDIVMHINTALGTLCQLGVGPSEGFMIEDDSATWDTFLGTDLRLNQAKSYVYLRARLLFDPPGTSFVLDAMKQQIQELEWRLNVQAEGAFG
jgi:hypothetical protein